MYKFSFVAIIHSELRTATNTLFVMDVCAVCAMELSFNLKLLYLYVIQFRKIYHRAMKNWSQNKNSMK